MLMTSYLDVASVDERRMGMMYLTVETKDGFETVRISNEGDAQATLRNLLRHEIDVLSWDIVVRPF